MKREIKFRVWNNRDKKMLNVAGAEFISGREIMSAGTLLPDEVVYGKNNGGYFSPMMQYTGLHDKNGRSIYEGDIVKMYQVVLSPDDKIGWVEYTAQYGYSIRFGNRRCRQSDWANDEGANYEVIGNIFEDKQLLEVAEHDAD